ESYGCKPCITLPRRGWFTVPIAVGRSARARSRPSRREFLGVSGCPVSTDRHPWTPRFSLSGQSPKQFGQWRLLWHGRAANLLLADATTLMEAQIMLEP